MTLARRLKFALTAGALLLLAPAQAAALDLGGGDEVTVTADLEETDADLPVDEIEDAADEVIRSVVRIVEPDEENDVDTPADGGGTEDEGETAPGADDSDSAEGEPADESAGDDSASGSPSHRAATARTLPSLLTLHDSQERRTADEPEVATAVPGGETEPLVRSDAAPTDDADEQPVEQVAAMPVDVAGVDPLVLLATALLVVATGLHVAERAQRPVTATAARGTGRARRPR